MRKIKRGAAVLVGVAATATASMSMAGPASAESLAAANCGSGYTQRDYLYAGDSANVKIVLFRKGNSACVVTWKQGGSIDNNVEISAWVDAIPGPLVGDKGRYARYAGPVKVTGDCVNWGGSYGTYENYSKPC
ncbi:hypothetical protein OHR68_37315 [Spirillospora sp. NBC_00431]